MVIVLLEKHSMSFLLFALYFIFFGIAFFIKVFIIIGSNVNHALCIYFIKGNYCYMHIIMDNI